MSNKSKTILIELRRKWKQEFSASQEIIKENEKEPIDWNKVFENYVFDKVLLSRLYLEPSQFNTKK